MLQPAAGAILGLAGGCRSHLGVGWRLPEPSWGWLEAAGAILGLAGGCRMLQPAAGAILGLAGGWWLLQPAASQPLLLLSCVVDLLSHELWHIGGSSPRQGDNNNSSSAATTIPSASLRNRTIRISKGKRKHTSSSYHPGESSSSLNEHIGSCLASSDTTAGRNHTTLCHGTPVIDIDDISSPEVRPSLSGYRDGTSSDPNISAQLEADELLARQLQEQLYNEPCVAPREEIDAIVAMSLQHEEDAGRTSRTIRQFQNDTRATRASRLSAAQRATRARYETAISNIRNAAPITLGLRAIVAGYPGARIQPNIDLNDYDALLALDENNHQHTGASESQINNLPESVFQPTSIEEPCAVCLENPSVGDTIRTLPCFHKFHKECIDEWLRRKKLCPVCKCGITRS